MDFKWDWGSFAKRAKEVILNEEDPDCSKTSEQQMPALQKGLDAITASLSRIGDTLGNAIEESLNVLAPEPKPKVKTSLKEETEEDALTTSESRREPGVDNKTQLKASRDVAAAMATKVKLLIRELKTVRSDLSFMKERCSQLEEENKRLRESLEKGSRLEEDELVRKQLETLVAEKSRLSQQNANYARENQFLHEVIEYHRLTLEDVSRLDERIEEVAETMPC